MAATHQEVAAQTNDKSSAGPLGRHNVFRDALQQMYGHKDAPLETLQATRETVNGETVKVLLC